MKSVFMRLFSSMAMVLIASFFLVGTIFFSYCTRYIITENYEALTTTADEVAHMTLAYSVEGSIGESWDFRMSIDSLGRATDSVILVCDEQGIITMSSGEEIHRVLLGTSVAGEQVDEVVASGRYFGVSRLGDIFSENMYVVGQLVPDGYGRTGLIFVAAEASDIMSMRVTLMSSFILIAVIIFAIAFFLTTYISRRMTRPIDEIAQAADSFANGHLDARVKTAARRGDELGRLAVSFNAMAESLEQSEKRRQEFVSNVSHELRTPMTTIGGFVDGMLDGTIPPERQQQYLMTISDEVRRLSRLVRTLLDSSSLQDQVEKQPWSPFDINELAVRVMLTFEQKIREKGLEVDMEISEEPLMVIGSSDAINQVIHNLMDNAAKFSNAGGRIGLRTKVKGGKAHITVSNTGESIPHQQLKLIFDRFHKTDESRSRDKEGVGLGLYIVKTIVTKHGEDIFVTSNDGLTEFTFTMTLAQKKQGAGGGNGAQHQQH